MSFVFYSWSYSHKQSHAVFLYQLATVTQFFSLATLCPLFSTVGHTVTSSLTRFVVYQLATMTQFLFPQHCVLCFLQLVIQSPAVSHSLVSTNWPQWYILFLHNTVSFVFYQLVVQSQAASHSVFSTNWPVTEIISQRCVLCFLQLVTQLQAVSHSVFSTIWTVTEFISQRCVLCFLQLVTQL